MPVIGQERDDINVTVVVKKKWIIEILRRQNRWYLESNYMWIFDFRNWQSFLTPSIIFLVTVISISNDSLLIQGSLRMRLGLLAVKW